jgi:hypothetical protein
MRSVEDPISARMKHIDIIYHHVRQRVQMQQMKYCGVPTQEKCADVITKPLAASLFQEHRCSLGVHPSSGRDVVQFMIIGLRESVKIHACGLGVLTCGSCVLTCIHVLDCEGTGVSACRCRLFSLPMLRPTLP